MRVCVYALRGVKGEGWSGKVSGSDLSPCCRYWLRGEGVLLQTVSQGEEGGIAVIGERRVGGFIS